MFFQELVYVFEDIKGEGQVGLGQDGFNAFLIHKINLNMRKSKDVSFKINCRLRRHTKAIKKGGSIKSCFASLKLFNDNICLIGNS